MSGSSCRKRKRRRLQTSFAVGKEVPPAMKPFRPTPARPDHDIEPWKLWLTLAMLIGGIAGTLSIFYAEGIISAEIVSAVVLFVTGICLSVALSLHAEQRARQRLSCSEIAPPRDFIAYFIQSTPAPSHQRIARHVRWLRRDRKTDDDRRP